MATTSLVLAVAMREASVSATFGKQTTLSLCPEVENLLAKANLDFMHAASLDSGHTEDSCQSIFHFHASRQAWRDRLRDHMGSFPWLSRSLLSVRGDKELLEE